MEQTPYDLSKVQLTIGYEGDDTHMSDGHWGKIVCNIDNSQGDIDVKVGFLNAMPGNAPGWAVSFDNADSGRNVTVRKGSRGSLTFDLYCSWSSYPPPRYPAQVPLNFHFTVTPFLPSTSVGIPFTAKVTDR